MYFPSLYYSLNKGDRLVTRTMSRVLSLQEPSCPLQKLKKENENLKTLLMESKHNEMEWKERAKERNCDENMIVAMYENKLIRENPRLLTRNVLDVLSGKKQ
jgi:hypothetical protein